MINQLSYKRKISSTEQLHLAMDAASMPLKNQLIIEFEGDINFELLQDAIEIASDANPGSRLVLRGRLSWAKWVDSGISPELIKIDAPWIAKEADNNPYIEREFDPRNGPTTEVLLFNNSVLLFRSHHAVMDGKGMVTWVEDIVKVLNGVVPAGSNCELTDVEQALSLGRKDFRPNYPADVRSPLGHSVMDVVGIQGIRKSIPGVYSGLVARIMEILTDELKISQHEEEKTLARFIIPVDMRRHRPSVRTTANMISALIINVSEKTNWMDFYQKIVSKLQANEEGKVGKIDKIFHYLPTRITASLLKLLFASQEKSKRFVFTATISNIGKINLADFANPYITAKNITFIPVADPLSAITIVTAEFDDHIDVTLSSLKSFATDQRQEKLLDLIEKRLQDKKEISAKTSLDRSIKQPMKMNDLSLLHANNIEPELNTQQLLCSPYELSFESSQFDELILACQKFNIKLESIVQLAWHKLVNSYTEDSRTFVGTVVNLTADESDFENKLSSVAVMPLMVEWNESKIVSQLLVEIDNNLNNVKSNANDNKLNSGKEQLYQSLIAFCDNLSSSDNTLAHLQDLVKVEECYNQWSKNKNCQFLIRIHHLRDQLIIKIDDCQGELNQRQSQRLFQQLKQLMFGIIKKLDKPHKYLSLLGEYEKHQILNDWNLDDKKYSNQQTIHQLFEEQVKKTPDAIALVHHQEELTYQQLYQQSNDLAIYLQSLGIKPDTLVGLCVEKSINMVIAILGILQAGGAYVPLSSDYPKERLKYMLEDSKITVLLTQAKFKQKLESVIERETQLILLDQQKDQINQAITLLKKNGTELEKIVRPHNLAYVIYTSGSTGQPKGVMNIHSNLPRIAKYTNYIDITPTDSILSLSSYIFDGSIFDLFTPLCNGAKLILSDSLVDIEKLEAVFKQDITVFITTALFNSIVNNRPKLLKLPKRILFGGEEVSVFHVKKALETNPSLNLIHVYGPTETTVFATYYPIDSEWLKQRKVKTIPIGKPLADTRIYILDKNNELLPAGVPGELHISGGGVARGYLNRTNLTAERFVPDPFNSGSLMYKTGDLARWLCDGNIEFLGRNDRQVKIRGFRIELGEIEIVLNELKEVKQAIVIDREKSENKFLAAYIVLNEEVQREIADSGGDINLSTVRNTFKSIRRQLESILPEYMLPGSYTQLEVIPLTVNGKLDRAALPQPEFKNTNEYIAPRNAIESKLCRIWQEVLEVEQVGINDNFFLLGGNSINVIALLEKTNKQFKSNLSISCFFASNSIASIGREITELEN